MAKKATVKDLSMLKYWNKINKIHEKVSKDPSGDLKLTTYIPFGTEVVFVQCWFRKGVCTTIMFDLEQIYNSYGGHLGGLQDVVDRFCQQYTYYEDRGNAVVAIDTEGLLDDDKYLSKLFTAVYVFIKNANEFFGNHEENVYDEDNVRTFYREFVTAEKKKHKTIAILSAVIFVLGIILLLGSFLLLGPLQFVGGLGGMIYHYIKVKHCDNEYFRVRKK